MSIYYLILKNFPIKTRIIAKSDKQLRNNLKSLTKALYSCAFEKKKEQREKE